MIARLLRRWMARPLALCARMLMRTPISPNQLTLTGLGLCTVSGLLLGLDKPIFAGVVLLLAGIFDTLDGALARQIGKATPFGGFIDSISDHYGDFAIYLGLMWYGLQRADSGVVLLTAVAMFGSLVGSQIRSRAAMLGLDIKDVGLFTRAERVIVLTVGLCSGWITVALVLLALGNNAAALQRLGYLLAQRARTDAPVAKHLPELADL
jgi:CDP-diacylglycerol--glycerol-3-phosphate 3-phosphatidyltransferase